MNGRGIATNRTRRLRPVDRTFARVFSNYTPPADLTVSQWAEAHRVLSRENSAEAGPWRNARTPYLVEIMDAFTDPKVEKISLVASSQVGKSELELNIIGYIIDQDPGSILYIQPTVDDAKKFSRLRIAPMIRDSATLRNKVADIMAALKVQEAGPKYCHFPAGSERGYDLAFFHGLLSEKLVLKSEHGRTRWAWVKLPGHERNEALDCRNYALAGLRILDPDMDAVERRLRGIQEQPAEKPRRKKVSRSRIAGDDW